MPYTYPAPAPTVSGDILSIHTLLQSPTLIARRLRTLAEQRFIADALLTARYEAEGGAVQYEQNESIYTDRAPRVVRPGGEYPMTGLGVGPTQIAEVQKWGQDVPITDESIKRHKRNPVDRAFTKLVNQMVKTVDSLAMSAISSAITQSTAAAAAWDAGGTTADGIITDVGLAKANIINLKQGYDPDVIVLDDITWTHVMAKMVKAGVLPRESVTDNPVLTGEFPTFLGLTWMRTPNLAVPTTATLLDTTQLGGMADEKLGGPGYTGATQGVETKSIRDDDNERYKLRARRVTVPVIIEPGAGWELTGVRS